MQQLVYKDRFFILGSFDKIISQLKALSNEYKTVKELLDSKTKEL